MTPRTPREVVSSVLVYVEGYLQSARLANDLKHLWHWQDCWCLIFRTFFGTHKVKDPEHLPMVPASVATPLPARPRWFVEKYSRPARKVVGQVTQRAKVGNTRECFSTSYDVLECGHKLASHVREFGAPPQRWRYCKECPPKQQPKSERGNGHDRLARAS